MDEHRTKYDQPMYQHHTDCVEFAEYLKFYVLPDIDGVNNITSKELHLHNVVTENTDIIDYNNNWAHLQYVEAYYLKTMSPEIIIGRKNNFNYSNDSHDYATI